MESPHVETKKMRLRLLAVAQQTREWSAAITPE